MSAIAYPAVDTLARLHSAPSAWLGDDELHLLPSVLFATCDKYTVDEGITTPCEEIETMGTAVEDLKSFGLLPRLPTAPDCSFVVATADGRELSFQLQPPGTPEEAARKNIAAGFGMKHTSFVLRDAHGGWISCASAATAGDKFLLELPNSFVRDTASTRPGDATLAWAMQPPSGDVEWLTISVNQSGGVTPARHIFDPPPAITLNSSCTENAARLLAGAVVHLWTPAWDDCTATCLHAGAPTLSADSLGNPVLSWPNMGITEISAKARPPLGWGTLPGAFAHTGGAAAQCEGWFHLSVSLPSGERLLLRDHNNLAAKLTVKHQRSENTGGWRKKYIGPYADHAECRRHGCHVDSTGTRRCREAGAECEIPEPHTPPPVQH